MNWGKAIVCIGMFINLSASIAYLCQHDYRRAIYWASAFCLNASITF
jgi:hypothetical protein